MINKITLTLLFCAALFTTNSYAQNLRLLAKTNATFRTPGSYTEDSVRYFHSGTKGNNPGKYKIPEFELMEDSSQTYEYSTTNKKLELKYRKVCTYTGGDFNESIRYSWNGTTWSNNAKTRAIYLAGKPDTVYYDSWSTQGAGSWIRSSRIIYTWNGNNVATRLRQTYSFGGGGNPPGWRNNRLYTYTYSGSNETEFIDAKWITSGGGSWSDSIKRQTTYAAGKISQVDIFKWDGTSWAPLTKSIYNRDGNSRLLLIKQDIFVTAWEENQKDTSIYLPSNTTQYPDTTMSLAFTFGNYINKGKWGYRYLTDGRYTFLGSLSWDGISVWKQTDNQDSIVNWYYGWNLDVENVDANKASLSVYPSPATNTINITLDGMTGDKLVEFSILDLQGRLMKNWKETSKTVVTMPINELPSGNYILHVSDGTQMATKQFVVTK